MKKIDVRRDYGVVDFSVIEAFERAIGYCFPSKYKELISKHNALQPLQDCFNSVGPDGEFGPCEFSFCGYGEWPIPSLIQDLQDFDIYGFDGVIAFGDAAGGDYVCFDYRQNLSSSNPRIVLMFHDQYIEDESGNPKMVVCDIAPDFETFINMLYERSEDLG